MPLLAPLVLVPKNGHQTVPFTAGISSMIWWRTVLRHLMPKTAMARYIKRPGRSTAALARVAPRGEEASLLD